MITPVDQRLRQEARRFNLRYGCEHCVAFDPERGLCAHCYPNAEHWGVDLVVAHQVVFCKEFEST
jgi:hypothetical protein